MKEIPNNINIDGLGTFTIFDYEEEGDEIEEDSVAYELSFNLSDERTVTLTICSVDFTKSDPLAFFESNAKKIFARSLQIEKNLFDNFRKEILSNHHKFYDDKEISESDYNRFSKEFELTEIRLFEGQDGFVISYKGGETCESHDLECHFSHQGLLEYVSYNG